MSTQLGSKGCCVNPSPAKLPEWKHDRLPPPSTPRIESKLKLTRHVQISFVSEEHGSAFLMGYRCGYEELAPFTTIEARKAEVLPLLLADMEEALPVLRAMVRKLEKAAELPRESDHTGRHYSTEPTPGAEGAPR